MFFIRLSLVLAVFFSIYPVYGSIVCDARLTENEILSFSEKSEAARYLKSRLERNALVLGADYTGHFYAMIGEKRVDGQAVFAFHQFQKLVPSEGILFILQLESQSQRDQIERAFSKRLLEGGITCSAAICKTLEKEGLRLETQGLRLPKGLRNFRTSRVVDSIYKNGLFSEEKALEVDVILVGPYGSYDGFLERLQKFERFKRRVLSIIAGIFFLPLILL